MAAHRTDAEPPENDREPSVLFSFLMPKSWRAELEDAASSHGISASDVVRMALRRLLSQGLR